MYTITELFLTSIFESLSYLPYGNNLQAAFPTDVTIIITNFERISSISQTDLRSVKNLKEILKTSTVIF